MKKLCISGAKVFSENYKFEECPLYFAGDRIITEAEYQKLNVPEQMIDAAGKYVIPGLTDIHFHGCMGYDCCDGSVEAFAAMAEYEGRQGVTSITPATMTMSEEVLMRVAQAAKEYRELVDGGKCRENAAGKAICVGGNDADFTDLVATTGNNSCGRRNAAFLAGLYMEGPFISEAKKGAQNAAYIRKPDADLVERLQQASGDMFKTVIVAPEVEGAMDFIRSMAGKVNISLGHTTADYDTAAEALKAGASELTHLYNAMMPFTHRSPGPMAAAADAENCMVELICDGVHIHPAVVRTTFKIFGDDRIIMISDSMRAAGLEDGVYDLGGQTVYVNGRNALLKDGTLAGSVTNLMGCLRTAVKEMGIPLESAVKCAAVNPAKKIGRYDTCGSLTPGKYANIVILDQELQVEKVYCRGERLK